MLTQTSHDIFTIFSEIFIAIWQRKITTQCPKFTDFQKQKEGEKQYLDASVFLEFQEYSPISTGDIFFVIRKKFPCFDDW